MLVNFVGNKSPGQIIIDEMGNQRTPLVIVPAVTSGFAFFTEVRCSANNKCLKVQNKN